MTHRIEPVPVVIGALGAWGLALAWILYVAHRWERRGIEREPWALVRRSWRLKRARSRARRSRLR